MEDILRKNIFNENELCKLSPDYTPSDIFVRMQLRRAMVRDTHSYGVHKNSNWQRKSPKRAKENYKINKEIAKIRNEFQKSDLKNHIIIKHGLKKVNSLKPDIIDDIINTDNLNDTNDDDAADLTIQNDTEVEVKSKPILVKKNRETVINCQNKQETKHHLSKDIKIVEENILRIECKQVCLLEDLANETKDESEIQEMKMETPTVYDKLLSSNGLENQESELQKLLVMMAISNPSNDAQEFERDDPIEDIESNSFQLTDLVLQDLIVTSSAAQKRDITDLLNVTALRIDINERERLILEKYVKKWREYVSTKKTHRSDLKQMRLNNFLNKLEKKKQNANTPPEATKAKLLVKDYKTYQHRYKVQKHIIALQKAKLEEQGRLIEELKYNKIVEASRQSVDAMKEEIRKTYFEIDRQLKPKIKLLTNELKIHEIEEPALVLHCLKVPQFLQRMEKRAREREEKHAMIRERRRQMEEERIRLKEQAELARAEMDKEEKFQRMKELKDKRKREKLESIRKKQHVERMRALIVIADLHYEKTLMNKYGIRPLRKLIEAKRDNLEKAKEHYRFQLMKNVFLNWMWYTEDMWFERNYKAEDFCKKKILRRVFDGLKQNHHEYVLKKQVADDYYDLYVTNLAFRKLREALAIVRREYEIKWQKVVDYHNSNLLFKTFTCWRTLPAINALKREQEARKAKWREKVLQVVPDYKPPED